MDGCFQKRDYANYISLGYFCEVAQDLEKMGLRQFSSPFDWGISNFQGVMDAIDHEFDGFMDYDNLSQHKTIRKYYHDDRYNYYSFHDFSEYKSLDEQYAEVKEKYQRRSDRFLKAIQSPTLFLRYISSEQRDAAGKSVELDWIEKNYSYILDVLKRYNPDNEIIFLGDETVVSDLIKVYQVPCDEGDIVSRLPIVNNKELYPILSSVEFPNREANIKRYEEKQKKKNSIFAKNRDKFKKGVQKRTAKEYVHSKIYDP